MKIVARIALVTLVFGLAAGARAQDHASHGQQPKQPAPPANQGFLGIRFQPIDEEVAKRLEIEEQDGLVAIEVIPGSPAEKAGLMPKDILRKIDGQATDDVDGFRALM